MKKVFVYFITITLIATILASCGEREEQVTEFINVNLIPMTEEKVVENQVVLIEWVRIIEIGPSNDVALPENATIIYGAGAYFLPGLAHMHMHTKDDWDDWPVSPLGVNYF